MKKKRSSRLQTQLRLLVLFAVLAAFPAAAQERGFISYLEGEVTVRRQGDRLSAEIGTGLLAGDAVSTGPEALAILSLAGRGEVKLRESTEMSIDSLGTRMSVTLRSGGIFSRIRKLFGNEEYEVMTPSMVAGVRGTEFFVAYGRKIEDQYDVWLCVNEGAVEVALPAAGAAAVVEEGEGINILGGNRLTEPKFYPWTEKLNWNMEPENGKVRDTTDLDEAYADLLDQDYD